MANIITVEITFNNERFMRDFAREMSLRSADEFEQVKAEMLAKVPNYVTVGDPLDADTITE